MIPIDDSLLYVEPVYLESSTDTSLPEVKRVIIAYHDRIAYGSTLAESLRSLFNLGADYEVDAGTSAGTGTSGAGGSSAANVGGADENAGSGAGAGASIPDLVSKASKAYDNAQAAMKEGDWAKYGQYQEELKSYLDQLDAASGSSGSASAEAASGDQAAGTDDSGSNNADNADKTAQN